jgi:hypothetical protein
MELLFHEVLYFSRLASTGSATVAELIEALAGESPGGQPPPCLRQTGDPSLRQDFGVSSVERSVATKRRGGRIRQRADRYSEGVLELKKKGICEM